LLLSALSLLENGVRFEQEEKKLEFLCSLRDFFLQIHGQNLREV